MELNYFFLSEEAFAKLSTNVSMVSEQKLVTSQRGAMVQSAPIQIQDICGLYYDETPMNMRDIILVERSQ